MGITRLNHAVLYVRDVERSVAFYTEVLGFRPIAGMAALKGAAFLQAPGSTNDHDLSLFGLGDSAGDSTAGRSTVGMYHLAWELATLAGRTHDGRHVPPRLGGGHARGAAAACR